MAKTTIDRFDLNISASNKSQRIPICICIEATKDIWISSVKDSLVRFFEKISSNDSLSTSVEVSIVTFGGNDEPQTIRPYKLVDSETYTIHEIKSEQAPDLNEALLYCINQAQLRKKAYNIASLNYHQPSIILIASGNHSADIEEAEIKIRTCSLKGTLNVVPMTTGQNIDNEVLRRLSSNGELYSLYSSLDQTDMFETIGKSLERLSESTSTAYESIISVASEEWAKLIRK